MNKIRLVALKDGSGFNCSGCGEKFVPIPFKPDEVLQGLFEKHVEEHHASK